MTWRLVKRPHDSTTTEQRPTSGRHSSGATIRCRVPPRVLSPRIRARAVPYQSHVEEYLPRWATPRARFPNSPRLRGRRIQGRYRANALPTAKGISNEPVPENAHQKQTRPRIHVAIHGDHRRGKEGGRQRGRAVRHAAIRRGRTGRQGPCATTRETRQQQEPSGVERCARQAVR